MIVCRTFDLSEPAAASRRSTSASADLAGQIDGVAVYDGAAHALARLDTLDGHGKLLLIGIKIERCAENQPRR